MVKTGEGWPKDNCEIFNIVRIPLVIGLGFTLFLATFALNIVSGILSCWRLQKVEMYTYIYTWTYH